LKLIGGYQEPDPLVERDRGTIVISESLNDNVDFQVVFSLFQEEWWTRDRKYAFGYVYEKKQRVHVKRNPLPV
jgi:hypothetical protein